MYTKPPAPSKGSWFVSPQEFLKNQDGLQRARDNPALFCRLTRLFVDITVSMKSKIPARSSE
jgi:hypothetical protein